MSCYIKSVMHGQLDTTLSYAAFSTVTDSKYHCLTEDTYVKTIRPHLLSAHSYSIQQTTDYKTGLRLSVYLCIHLCTLSLSPFLIDFHKNWQT